MQLYRAVQEKMVGFKNVDFALKNGIIKQNEALTNEHLFNAIDRTDTLLKQKEDVLQQILQNEAVQVPSQDIFPKLMKVIRDSPPSPKVPDIQPFEIWMMKQVQADAARNGGINTPATVEDLISGKYPVSLSTVNQIKRALGEYYNESPLHRKLYSTIRQYIEDASGVPQGVKTINKEMSELISVKDNLIKNSESGSIAKQYTPEAIQESINRVKEVSPKSLHTAVGLATTVPGMIAGGVGGNLLGLPGLGIGGGAAGGVIGYFKLMQMLSSPGAKEALKSILENTAGKTYDTGAKMNINSVLQQLGVRLPGINQ
ncbi:hypothetical protein M1437_03240 [Patescibacteria group bacterium]|nr:hypothetical protein [Patescibacteria group bacterium]